MSQSPGRFCVPAWLERPPAEIHLHFIGVCGVGMGPVAIAAQSMGYRVTGSDTQADPPISLLLESSGIAILPEPPLGVDAFILGRGIDPDHAAANHPNTISFPELVAHWTAEARERVVVAGTKGKTTTTAMLAWIAACAGFAPDYLIGGVPGNFSSGLQMNQAALAILEGDETGSSPTDSTPKFVHYRPTSIVLTNIYPDHEELFADWETYRALFVELLQNLPSEGFAVVCGDASANIPTDSPARVITVGWDETNTCRLTDYVAESDGTRFSFLDEPIRLPVPGKANAIDAALAIAAARELGIAPHAAAAALATFCPVKERLELVATPGGRRLYVESNAHPAALRIAVETLRAASGRLVCVVQPQMPGARDGYIHRALAAALAPASHVLIAPPANPLEVESPFSSEALVADLVAAGTNAVYGERRGKIVAWVKENSQPGDAILLAVHAPSRTLLATEIALALA